MSSDKNIFQQTAHLTDEQMLGYLRNNLSRQERHAIEKHLVDCSFCSDGLEGLKKMENESRILTISDELRQLARKRKPAMRRKIFSQLDLITLFVLIFLILFLIIVAVVMFLK